MKVVNSQQLESTVDYDLFVHIDSLLQDGKSWRQIEKIIGKDKSYLHKYHKKQKTKRYNKTKLVTADRVAVTNSKVVPRLIKSPQPFSNISRTIRNNTAIPVNSRYDEDQFPRLPKYGNLPPTGHISDLSDDDWIIKYCGPLYSWKLAYLTDMRQFLRKTPKGIVYLPRGYGKTKSVIGLDVRDNVELNLSLLILVSGPSAQRKLFREFKRILMSTTIRRDYGDIMISFSTITGEAYYVDELQKQLDPALKVVGRGGDVIGSHPDKIHFEDIIQEEFKSDESNESLKEWYSDVIEYCALEQTRITVTGTRKGVDDWYSWLASQNFEVLHKRSIVLLSGDFPILSDLVIENYDDGSGLIRSKYTDIKIRGKFKTLECPNWPLKRLLMASTLNASSFESQMQNNPLPSSGLYFSADDFIVIDPSKYNNNDYKDYYIFIDPAYGRSKKSDNTSIMVFCVVSPKLVIVDGIIDRLTFTEIEMWLDRYIKKYQPHTVHAEDNFLQVWLLQHTKAKAWPMIGLTQTKNKIMRISATKAHWIEHRIEVLNTYPGREKLYNEYVQYDELDSTTSKKDDGLDTVAMGCEQLAQYVRSIGVSWYN